VWFDDDVVEVRVWASNGRFSGETHAYISPSTGSEFAAAIRGFPTSSADVRAFELGTFDDKFAGGGARFDFACLDEAGHPFVFVRLRGDPRDHARANAEFSIEFEAAALDGFVSALARLGSDLASHATLSVA
jgi:hypothetical protein